MTRKVIAFDCFGTVFDTAAVPARQVHDYVRQVAKIVWEPLILPWSWSEIPAHADARLGIEALKDTFRVVTCSNLPSPLLRQLSNRAGIFWSAIVPLEAGRAYKPDPRAYQVVCDVMQVEPEEVLVVSAHTKGPDVTGAPEFGMGFQLIRQPGYPQTIIELVTSLSEDGK